MKSLIVLLIGLINCFILLAQDPNPCYHITHCDPDKVWPFYFCEGGDVVIRCVHNPNTDNPPYKPLKAPGRVCLMWNTPLIPDIVTMPTNNGYDVPVYTNSVWDPTCEDANKNWACLCMFDVQPCSCYVLIEFSDDETDFSNATTNCASSSFTVNTGTCEIDCNSNPIIYINNTDKYTGRQSGCPGTEKKIFLQ